MNTRLKSSDPERHGDEIYMHSTLCQISFQTFFEKTPALHFLIFPSGNLTNFSIYDKFPEYDTINHQERYTHEKNTGFRVEPGLAENTLF